MTIFVFNNTNYEKILTRGLRKGYTTHIDFKVFPLEQYYLKLALLLSVLDSVTALHSTLKGFRV